MQNEIGNIFSDIVNELQKQADTQENTEAEQEETLRMEEFAKQHAPITVAFHQEWKSSVMVRSYFLPCEASSAGSYGSRFECEKAAKEAVCKAYELAERYVTAGDSKSVSRTVAAEYAGVVQSVFKAHQEMLQSYCQSHGYNELYNEIVCLVHNSEKSLRSVLDEELKDSSDYYKMYRLDYFLDKIEIEEIDGRISENEILRIMEALFADNLQYTYTGVWAAISEMEKDLNEHITTFYRRAYTEYCAYLAEIERLLDALDADFMKQQQRDKKQESAIEKTLKKMMQQKIE